MDKHWIGKIHFNFPTLSLQLFGFSFVCTRFLYPFRCIASNLRRPSPVACDVGHVAVFAVNAALVASHWQRRALTALAFCTHPFDAASTRLEKPQVPFFKSSVWPGRESSPSSLPGLAARVQPTVPSSRCRYSLHCLYLQSKASNSINVPISRVSN